MRIFLIAFVSFIFSSFHAQSFYWIGGSGSWSDGNHWSITSGGIASGTIPVAGSTVYFDGSSGLTNASVVTLDVAINVAVFDFSSALSAFQFSSVLPFIEVSNSVVANPNPSFGAWTGYWKMINSTIGTIQSNGRLWTNDFHFNGTALVTASNFQSNADVFLNSGTLSFQSTPVQFSDFYSLGSSNRLLNLTGSTVSLTGTTWSFGGTNYSLNSASSQIVFGSLSTSIFNGGGLNYHEVRTTNGPLDISGNNQVNLLKSLPAGNTLRINNGDTLMVDSLVVAGNCSSKTLIRSINMAGTAAKIVKNGFPVFRSKFLTINRVTALSTAGQSYLVALSDTSNQSLGWQYVGAAFYWIGNSGNYTDPAHWSLSSGGLPTTCLPTILDSIYFDALSFNLPNQQVNFNGSPEFAYMNWSNINQPTVGLIQSNTSSYGNVILDQQLSLNKASNAVSLLFRDKASLTSNNSVINTNVSVVMLDSSDSLILADPLVMTDTVNFSIFNGGFNTMNFDADFGYFSVNNQLASTFQRVRLGNSHVNIHRNFTTVGTTANFQFFAGNSIIYIGSQSSENNLRTANLSFNEVNLYFPKYVVNTGGVALNQPQKIEGNNVFKKLRILAGSYVQIQGASTQTILDSLILNGNCQDSIYLYSSNNATPALFVKNTPGNVTANCVNFTSVGASGTATFTAYFSTNSGAAAAIANWNLSATPAVSASFVANGPFCYNDTTFFTNTSTSFSGNPNDVSFLWYFGDGTNTFYADSGYVGIPTPCTPCAGDSVLVINGVPDTNAHIFAGYGSFNVMMIAEYSNFCVDTAITSIQISNPDIFVICSDADTTICQGSLVSFDIGSSNNTNTYAWYLNGNLLNNPPSSNDTLYQTSSLQNNDTLTFMSIEGVCASSSQPSYVFTVNPVPNVGLVSNDIDNTICAQGSISFTGSGAQQYRFLVNNVAVTAFTANPTFSSSSLNNGDVVKVVGKFTSTGCLDTSNAITVTVNPLPIVSLLESSGGNLLCANQSVTFTAGGASTYQFYVNNVPVSPVGGASFTASGLVSFDTVEVLGISSAGCSAFSAQSFGYVVNPLPNITLSFNDLDTSICQGTNVNFNATGGVLYQFFLNGLPTGPLASTNSFNTSGLVHNDNLYVSGYFNGCTNYSDTVVFEVLALPTTALTSNDADSTVCQGTTVVFNASGATQYEFFVGGVSQGIPSPINVFTTNALSNGQSVSVTGTTNGCSVTDQIPFTILPLPNVPIFSNNPQNTLCFGQSIGINGAGAAQYQLVLNGTPLGAPQASPSFTPVLPVGTNSLYIQGVGANSCAANSSTISVQVNPIPVVTLQSSDLDNIFCSGDTVSITASGANQYQFFLNGISQGNLGNINVFTSNGFANGQSITALGNSLGCTSVSAPMTFTVNPIPTVTITSNDPNNLFCQGDNVTYQANGASSYSMVMNGQLLYPPGAQNTVPMQSYPPGAYVLQAIGSSSGCSNQSSVAIQINPNPTVSLSSSAAGNALCSGQTIAFTATGASQYQFQVNGNNYGVLSGSNTQQINSLVNGDVVSVIGISNLGCSNTNILPPFTVNQTPQTSLTSSELDLALCVGTPVLFTASGATSYEFFVNGISQGPATSNPNLTLNNLQDNDLVEVLGYNQNCSDYSPSLLFNVFNYPNVNISNSGGNQICVGDLVNATATGANNYQFYVNSQPIGPNSNNNNFVGTLNNGDTLTVLGETFGCSAFAVTPISLVVYPYPIITTVCSDIDLTICLLDTVSFSASGALTYEFTYNNYPAISSPVGQYSIDDLLQGDTVFIQGFNGTCPSAVDTFVFNVNSMSLSLSSMPNPIICLGTNLSFQASGASTYLFYVNGIPQGAFNPAGQYNSSSLQDEDWVTFTGFNANTGCYQPYQDSVLVDVFMLPNITYNSPITFCEGDSVILESNSTINNLWEINGVPVIPTTDSTLIVYQTGQVSLSQSSSALNQTYSFGYNANGMFGDGTNQSSTSPIEMNNNLALDEVSSGWNFSLGLNAAGQVYAWGNNATGQLGNGTYTSSNVPLLIPALSNIKSLATSENSALALSNNGSVYVWGNNTFGQLGTGNTSVYNFPFLNASLQNIDTICGGRRHFLCLRNDGKVLSFGNNSFGQLGLGNLNSALNPLIIPSLSGIEKIGVGEFHSFAIDSMGNTFVWGNNANGQLGLGDNLNRTTPTLSTLKNLRQINGGADFSVFLKADGTVWSTGKNNVGQLGLNDLIDRSTPEKVAISGVHQISCGQYHTLLLRNDFSVFGFGDNTEGQLTAGPNVISPIHLSTLHGTVFVESGKSTSHAINGAVTSCTASSLSITVNSAPIPQITLNNGLLSTNAVGSSYQWYFGGQEIQNSNSATYVPITSGYYTVEVTYPSGCSATSMQYAFGIQNLDELKAAKTRIYPVPTNAQLTIESATHEVLSDIEIIDAFGRVVLHVPSTGVTQQTVDVGMLSSGTYVVSFEDGEKLRFMVSH